MYSPKSNGYEKKDFQEFVNANNIGVIAVDSGEWNVQATTVFYAVESEVSLLIKSHTASNHGRDMQLNPKVVLVIYDCESIYTNKSGVQLRCEVEKITDYDEMVNAVAVYSKSFPGAEQRFAPIEELISEDVKSTLFRLKIVSGKMLTPDGYSEEFQELS